jgi:hypothetical protein
MFVMGESAWPSRKSDCPKPGQLEKSGTDAPGQNLFRAHTTRYYSQQLRYPPDMMCGPSAFEWEAVDVTLAFFLNFGPNTSDYHALVTGPKWHRRTL